MPITGDPMGDNQQKAAAIRARAQQLALSPESQSRTVDAELLAGLADGTLSLDSIDDDALEHSLDSQETASFVQSLLEGKERTHSIPGDVAEARVGEMPVNRQKASRSLDEKRTLPNGSAWWRMHLVWAGLAAAAAVATLAFFLITRSTKAPEVVAGNLTVQWPATAPFDAAGLKRWGLSQALLPTQMPDFNTTTGTLGAGGNDRFLQWRMATVIVRSPNGWGSGAFISGDGWLLTNHHVVADAAQVAALTGSPAILDVITAGLVDGRIKPQAPLHATIYRIDPVHDLTLLKLDSLPPGRKQVPYFPLASQIREGEDCFVIGSQHGGPAWWVRSGNVSQLFDFPEDLSDVAAGVASSGANIDRNQATVVVTDARVSPGDSGGPLLNAKGELMGLTFATSANQSGGSVGWHIALQHLRSFVASLPTQPEGAPFDIWTAGLPHASMLEPALADGDHDGRVDSLVYRFAVQDEGEPGGASPRAAALEVFVDFSERYAGNGKDSLDLLPSGLWGMESRGRFRFDLVLTNRADGITAVGYTNADGVVDNIRIARSEQTDANLVWTRDNSGAWRATKPAVPVELFDSSRLGPANLRRLQVILGLTTTPGGGRQAPDRPFEGSGRGPNKK